MLTKIMKDERDRMRKDTALLISKVLMMVCLAVGAVLIFRSAGTVAVVVTSLLCSAAIVAKSMLQRNPLPAEESASKQKPPWVAEVKSIHQKSGHWVEKLQGVAAA
jgi:hypothetical protein